MSYKLGDQMRGKFITLEGGEGAGKSTQAAILCEFLRTKGIDVVQTREVGGCPSAETIRSLWLSPADGHWDGMTELLLIMAARREHLIKTIYPALSRGAWVVSDRFADSTRAYQGIGLGLGPETVETLYRQIAPNFEPDMTLLLDLPVEASLKRMTARQGPDDRYQQKDATFHLKLREAYLELAKNNNTRIHIIDASGDATAVASQISSAIQNRFAL